MKIQGGQKFSHALEQTLFGTENHLHAEMKTQWTVSLKKRQEKNERGLKEERGNHKWSVRDCLSHRGSRGFFPSEGVKKKYGWMEMLGKAKGRIKRIPSLVLEKENFGFCFLICKIRY